MYLKTIKGHLYFYKRKSGTVDSWYCTPLGLRSNEKTKGVQAVGAILADLDKGIEPTSAKTRVRNL